jgi:hypothetical protein
MEGEQFDLFDRKDQPDDTIGKAGLAKKETKEDQLEIHLKEFVKEEKTEIEKIIEENKDGYISSIELDKLVKKFTNGVEDDYILERLSKTLHGNGYKLNPLAEQFIVDGEESLLRRGMRKEEIEKVPPLESRLSPDKLKRREMQKKRLGKSLSHMSLPDDELE